MSFQTPITIKKALEEIENKKYLLPAIQRKFVWESEKIEKLFDSLIKGYPIGSFLFWKVKNTKDYRFYEFIQNFDIREKNKDKPKKSGFNEKIAILDGQQRLTALYIGLYGSYTEKKIRGSESDPDSYQKNFYV